LKQPNLSPEPDEGKRCYSFAIAAPPSSQRRHLRGEDKGARNRAARRSITKTPPPHSVLVQFWHLKQQNLSPEPDEGKRCYSIAIAAPPSLQRRHLRVEDKGMRNRAARRSITNRHPRIQFFFQFWHLKQQNLSPEPDKGKRRYSIAIAAPPSLQRRHLRGEDKGM
jgi:hypothetical protein